MRYSPCRKEDRSKSRGRKDRSRSKKRDTKEDRSGSQGRKEEPCQDESKKDNQKERGPSGSRGRGGGGRSRSGSKSGKE